jgi:hypothetical protein
VESVEYKALRGDPDDLVGGSSLVPDFWAELASIFDECGNPIGEGESAETGMFGFGPNSAFFDLRSWYWRRIGLQC